MANFHLVSVTLNLFYLVKNRVIVSDTVTKMMIAVVVCRHCDIELKVTDWGLVDRLGVRL